MLTHKQIQVAAKKSRKAAIACTHQHWEELKAAKLEELRAADAEEPPYRSTLYIGCGACALCIKCDDDCKKCGLWDGQTCRRSNSYRKTTNSFVEYRITGKGRAKWQRACQEVIDQLGRLKWKSLKS